MKIGQDFDIPRGDDRELEFTALDEDDDDAPKSLTGATEIKWEAFQGSTAIIQKTYTGSGGVTLFDVDVTDDGVRVTLEPADTEDLDDGIYTHELECVIGGKRVTLAQGNLTLIKDRIANP